MILLSSCSDLRACLSVFEMLGCRNNNKDEDNSPKTLNDKDRACL